MRKPEQKQWDYLSRQMSGLWDAQRHEDRHSPDVPDVSFAMQGIDGWLELKTLAAWPKRSTTQVYLEHLTSGQVNWLERRGSRGSGRVWLLLAVGTEMAEAEWLLVPSTRVRTLYEREYKCSHMRLNFGLCHGQELSKALPYALRG